MKSKRFFQLEKKNIKRNEEPNIQHWKKGELFLPADAKKKYNFPFYFIFRRVLRDGFRASFIFSCVVDCETEEKKPTGNTTLESNPLLEVKLTSFLNGLFELSFQLTQTIHSFLFFFFFQFRVSFPTSLHFIREKGDKKSSPYYLSANPRNVLNPEIKSSLNQKKTESEGKENFFCHVSVERWSAEFPSRLMSLSSRPQPL